MNGPEHYREAERLLTRAADAETAVALYLLSRAQVHATLALAAATVDASGFGVPGEVRNEAAWREAVKP